MCTIGMKVFEYLFGGRGEQIRDQIVCIRGQGFGRQPDDLRVFYLWGIGRELFGFGGKNEEVVPLLGKLSHHVQNTC